MEEYIITIEQLGRFAEGRRPGVKRNNDGERSSVRDPSGVSTLVESLEIYHRNILDKNSEETRITILLDDCPIKIIRIMPFDYTSNEGAITEKLYMLQFVYNDEINTAMIHQLTLTHDGYGFSRKGPKHRLDIGVFYADPS
jgi:hypothetical protein